MSRRELLTWISGGVGGIVVGAHLFGDDRPDDGTATQEPTTPTEPEAPGTETRTTTSDARHADEFGTVVDAIAAGADPTGEEEISEFLEEYAADDTLLSFPPGTYRLPPVELLGYDHLGIAAARDEHPTFVPPAGSCTDSKPHLKLGNVTDILLEGIDFDFRREGAGASIHVVAAGDATVRDVTARGTCRGQIAMFRIDIRDPEGTGLVERLTLRNVQDSGWITGAYVGKHHSGEVTFQDPDISEFTDNGLYASAPGLDDGGGGSVHTVDGAFENNNVTNIRLGTAGSTARSDTIVVESAPEAEAINLRGIRFRRGADQVVEDCDITFGSDVTESFGAIVYHRENAGARVANSTVTMHSDRVPAVQAIYYSGDTDTAPTFENLTIDGDASRGYAALINGRDGTRFENCTIEQTGDHRNGIRIAYSDDCELVNSRIDVTGYPLILRDSTLTIRDTTFVTPDGERHVEEMEAGPGDFRPSEWA